jgi:hypothetical protein
MHLQYRFLTNSVSRVINQVVIVAIMNVDTSTIQLGEDQQIASVSNLVVSTNFDSPINQIVSLGDTSEVVSVGDNLTKEQLRDLAKLFSKRLNAFSVRGELGRADIVEHEIELIPGARPFKEPVRRHPPTHAKEADRQVAEMLSKGIIEPSSSPWASEYVLVKKKDGRMEDLRRFS